MKTIYKFLILLFGLNTMIVISVTNCWGQNFQTANVATTTAVGSTGVLNTGNDAFEANGITWEVNVYDGSSPGISWYVDDGIHGSVTSNTSLVYSNAIDPDVVLMAGNSYNDIYAFVVYYSTSAFLSTGGFVWERFKAHQSYPQSFSLDSWGFIDQQNLFGTTINIDRDENFNFVIVWDGISGNVRCRTGSGGSNVPPSFTASAFTVISGPTMPDVTLWYDGSSTENAYITYVTSGGNLQVDEELFSDLSQNPGYAPNNIVLNQSPTYAYSYPRIASQAFASPWEVVVQDDNGGTYLIEGFNSNTGSTAHIYDDGSSDSPYDISSVANLRPVVTFSDLH